MKTQMMRKGFSSTSEISKFETTGKTMKNLRLRISAMALCYLAMVIGSAVLPCEAESVLTTGSVIVTTPIPGLDWNGSPQSNPNQILANSAIFGSGAFGINLNYTQDGFASTEYGITWNMTNNSGLDWYSMHFTLQYAPLDDFSMTFDAGEGLANQPGNTAGYGLDNWSDTNIDFSGGAISGSGGTVSFFLPLDANGKCCSGNFIVWATPDYSPGTTPEPSSLALFGSGILGVGGLLRRRFLG